MFWLRNQSLFVNVLSESLRTSRLSRIDISSKFLVGCPWYVFFVPSPHPLNWKPTQSVKAAGERPLWKIDTSIHVLYQCKLSNQLLYKPRLVAGSNCTCVWVTSLEDPLTSLDSDRTSGSSQSSHFLHQCQYLGGFSFPQVATCVHRTLKMFYLNLAF